MNSNNDAARVRNNNDPVDEIFGFYRFSEGTSRRGWLLNYVPITAVGDHGYDRSGLELYFIDKVGQHRFKARIFFRPYFFVDISDKGRLLELGNFLSRKFDGCTTEVVEKEDLDLPNHLSGLKHSFIKLSFHTVSQLIEVKSAIRKKLDNSSSRPTSSTTRPSSNAFPQDPFDCIIDIKEFDVSYTMRVAIDMDIRVGAWYTVSVDPSTNECSLRWDRDDLELCEPKVLAFDIECEKSPLKFPNAENDRIFMISYMTLNQGYLIINRDVVSEDIEDFEYSPKPNYPGLFKVINVQTEYDLLIYFLQHVQKLQPNVIVSYNGDKFDWPYLESRCSKYSDLSLFKMLSITSGQDKNKAGLVGETQYQGRCMVHLDAFCWVQRDSYLPQGNQGLKAVTKSKLGYDPIEVDPEDMLRLAKENPHRMASYSVSDAVSTYYLYSVYVHNFIFSMSTIIPLNAEDVLRKGSGTLCEALLMVEAFKGNIICPNKQVDPEESFYDGHLLESETYIGGHVECLEAGIFRNDLPAKFSLVPSAFQLLIDNIDRDLSFTLEVEHGYQRSDVTNYEEVKQAIVTKLELLRDFPERTEHPLIYHLDVGAMYPNIILTNRLQPSSMVDIHDCASCVYNKAKNDCKRSMTWLWRGEYSPANVAEYNAIKTQLSFEKMLQKDGRHLAFMEMPTKERTAAIRARLKAYCQRAFRKTKVTKIEERINVVCMRENSFYVDTVKAFRDRRYEYKLSTKQWKKKKTDAENRGDMVSKKQAEDREILMDSLQLAHKCILNSFYGYVMRTGARWKRIEMAGIVTHTGAQIIKQARELVEQVGRPLELDTDGIWCILPSSFPQNFQFRTNDNSKINFSYPCAMLNTDVHAKYTNHQYQVKGGHGFSTQSECSIFFELDGPYKAMILPASPEEGKLLKKKYVVYNFDGSIAELKGFELKRRGELELVKIFQSQVFEQFLSGSSLEECYAAVGDTGNRWLDVLETNGEMMDDNELLELISERKTISKTVEDYEGRKSTSLTTAGRLADFLGAEMIKDKGLNCNLVISSLPIGAPVTDRAIPVAIFSCESSIRNFFLRKWLKDPTLECDNFRSIIDWSYYKERLGKAIQKIVTIPAGMQKISNPCPRIEHPVWLNKQMMSKKGLRQRNMLDSFAKKSHEYLHEHKSAVVVDGESTQAVITSTNAVQEKVMEVEDTIEDGITYFSLGDNGSLSLPRFKSWLQKRKLAWRKRRAAKGGPSADSLLTRTSGKLADFINDAHISVVNSSWQIVELQEREMPGEYFVWVIAAQSQMHKFQLTIPRILFINIRDSPNYSDMVKSVTKWGGVPTKRDLPSGKIAQEVYELEFSEAKFLRNEKKITSLLNSAELEGVYESRIPLAYRAILNVGCSAKVSAGAKKLNRVREGKYFVGDLERVQDKYLSPSTNVKKVFLYYFSKCSRSGGVNGIIGIFILDKDSLSNDSPTFTSLAGKGYIWIITGRASLESKPPMNRILQKYFPLHHGDFKFIVDIAADETDALSKANSRLTQYNRERPGPTIIVAQGGINFLSTQQQNSFLGLDSRKFRSFLPALHDFPLAIIPASVTDGSFPAIGWSMFAAERMVQRFLLFPRWLCDRVLCARYAQIPVCNLGNDALTKMMDVLYGRSLVAHRHALWTSDLLEGPNLQGGGDESFWSAELPDPTVNNKGFFRSYVAELDLYGLSISAIMNSSDESDLRIHNSSSIFGKGHSRAFSIFKKVVSEQVDIVSRTGHSIGDNLLAMVYQYLAGYGGGILTDEQLHHTLANIMLRQFEQLLEYFSSLGVHVVFANFSKIIICAKESYNEHDAIEYVDFILSAINSQKCFRLLQISVKTFWRQLIWIDQGNWAGLKGGNLKDSEEDINDKNVSFDVQQGNDQKDASSNKEIGPGESLEDLLESFEGENFFDEAEEALAKPNDQATNDSVQIVHHWNMLNHVPEVVKSYFTFILGEFFLKFTKSIDLLVDDLAESYSDRAQDQEIRTEDVVERANKSVIEWIEHEFMCKMLEFVDDLSLSTFSADEIGNSRHKNIPLEFVKMVMEAFLLCDATHDASSRVKRVLMTQMQVKEYSYESKFTMMNETFLLRDTVCSSCGMCRDIDLLKEMSMICVNCNEQYNVDDIEIRLLKDAEVMLASFLVQDFRDSKTNVHSQLCASFTSSSSEKLSMDHASDLTIQHFIKLKRIATTHNLRSLLQCLDGEILIMH